LWSVAILVSLSLARDWLLSTGCRKFLTRSARRMPHFYLRCWWIIATIALALGLRADARGADRPLFDGKTLQGWTMANGQPVTQGWEVVDGMIHLKPSNESTGHIVTDREYGDFDLSFEWRISPGGNNGLKYRVRDYEGRALGCEYQIIDDAHHSDALTPNHRTGALYDLYESDEAKVVKPVGEFNLARIVVRRNKVQHWLNGRLILSATIGSAEWNARLARSKFSDLPDFSRNTCGKLMLTDHGDEVWYRNFEIHELTKSSPTTQRHRRHHRPIRNWIRQLRCRN
jgi:hypothetical protein